ncbi:hypothetical protein FN846DRAFT_1025781 [Sphaerosporella brunnea]|uniref:G-patch domain-containing protein n=1 Tax=Sphaerosporella brunnea TaxID=1250544 RepID=A0A5J5EEC9_9PEZI|nr:hypothetical protein FN846DRAFT_1025781 [Sphaerosporella brunnea]
MPPKRFNLSIFSQDDDEDEAPVPRTAKPKPKSASPAPPPPPASNDDDEEEDDYMSMAIPEPTSARETLTERMKRQQRERELRGRPKSKAELAREAAEKREAALAKSMLEAEEARSNKGLRMMKMMGYKPGTGLGSEKTWGKDDVRLEPVGVALKENRAGIGHATEVKRKLEDAAGPEGKRVQVAPEEFRERVKSEREEKRAQARFYAAQKVLEGLDMKRDFGVEEVDIGKAREIPLSSINVLWRGLVMHREEQERERRARYDMEQGLSAPRLPGYDRLHELDEVDKIALGVEPKILGEKMRSYVEDDAEEAEEEDEELREFEELPWAEKLEMIVSYLRTEHNYCFWCKWKYETAEMEGCPGTDEDSHG